jgi:hypothetical protein
LSVFDVPQPSATTPKGGAGFGVVAEVIANAVSKREGRGTEMGLCVAHRINHLPERAGIGWTIGQAREIGPMVDKGQARRKVETNEHPSLVPGVVLQPFENAFSGPAAGRLQQSGCALSRLAPSHS